MHCCHGPVHSPFHCFVPPHVLDRLAQSGDPQMRARVIDTIARSSAARSTREVLRTMPIMAAIPSPGRRKHRLIYDMQRREFGLPGTLVRSEGEEEDGADESVNNAYRFSGITFDCYEEFFGRNSLDGNGMTLISSVHFGDGISNAFWNGEQMLYGDGDGHIFLDFTRSLEVVAHELTHGVIMYTANLEYQDESGALNESFADVMSAVIEQRHRGQSVTEAGWLMGDELIGPDIQAEAFRTFKEGPAYENDPVLGTDPQTKHYDDIYRGPRDNGGVHINSGIANHAFYTTAMELGGNSWDKAGPIWYRTLLALHPQANFAECAAMCHIVAGQLYGSGSLEQQAVAKGWAKVGLAVETV